jgi:hypothetical protein
MDEQEISRTIRETIEESDPSSIEIGEEDHCCCILSIPSESIHNIIVTKDHERMIAPNLGTSIEVSNEAAVLSKYLEDHPTFAMEQYEWFKSMEATLVRLYFWEDKWCLSTQKKIDAFQSKWSCQYSFGELFVSCLNAIFETTIENMMDWFTDQLDRTKCYLFLIRSNIQNRIVCAATRPENQLVYLGYFLSSQTHYPVGFHHSIHESVETQEKVFERISIPEKVSFDSLDHLVTYTKSMNPLQYQGVIGLHKGNGSPLKILHADYYYYQNVRGNNPNIKFRYLEIRTVPDKLRVFYYLYPKYIDQFDEFENILFEICRIIYRSYINRYVKKKYVTLPKEEYNIMKKCHDWFHQDRKNNKIYTQKIMEFINEENAENLYKMIHRYLSHSRNQKEIFSAFFYYDQL